MVLRINLATTAFFATVLFLQGCSVNPVTGKKRTVFYVPAAGDSGRRKKLSALAAVAGRGLLPRCQIADLCGWRRQKTSGR